jgi:hypothetical protein
MEQFLSNFFFFLLFLQNSFEIMYGTLFSKQFLSAALVSSAEEAVQPYAWFQLVFIS